MKHRNTWSGGRNADFNASFTPENQYLEAQNLELVGEGAFLSLRNIKGTTNVQALDNNIEVLTVFNNKYLISNALVDGLTVFSASSTTFKIQAYIPSTGTLYDLFAQTIDADYRTSDRVVQGVNGPEGGVDHIYFSDFYFEMRHLKCEIPDSYTANFLSEYDLSLLRRGANGTITLTSVASGGTLLSGTYQFAYRMLNATDKSLTKWSSLTNPIHVYSAENGTSVVNSGIGLLTDRMITLSISPATEETDQYDQIQLAVIENVGPTPALTASLLEIESIPGTSLAYEYKSNSQIGTIPIEDVTVDLAQIKKVKTLAIKDNRLFAGNIHYTSLEMDNGTPQITSGSIITQADSGVDSFSNDEFASKYKGHWRGEVYRYAAVYRDEHGNAAPPQVLDLSGVTDNAITAGLTDLKFPDRTSASYTLFNSSGYIQSLGLRLTGLNNHPSWARSVEIVRVNRVGKFKNILFQTPIIPMVRLYGTGALGSYPTQVTYDTSGDNRSVDDASPMTSGYTLVPKNLFWPENRSIQKSTASGGAGINKRVPGEAVLQRVLSGGSSYTYSMIFPSDTMYVQPYIFGAGEKFDFIDYGLMKLSRDIGNSSVVNGDDAATSVAGTFHALSGSQYFYNSGHGKSDLSGSYKNKPIVDAKSFDNFGVTTTVSGTSVMDYDSFQTANVDLGLKPSTQRCAVIRMSGVTIPDATESAMTFSAATWNGTSNGGAITSASATLKFESSSSITNKYVTDYATFSNGNSYVSVIAIGNIKRGLGDDRYGDNNSLHEYISTGCKYTFSSSEIATLEGGGDVTLGDLDVWGGDCFVGPHVFKVADSAYSVVNQTKHNGAADTTSNLLSKWNNTLFKDLAGDSILCLPVAVEGAAQFVQVVLESEYNGEVRESDILSGSSASVPVMTAEAEAARTPLTYRYNINLSKNNDQKIFVPKPEFSFEQNEFGSRVIYSDLKIYNSDVAGFDIFRVGNIYDIEERYRNIVKLAVGGNQLYSIHEQGLVYLPTGERQLEQSDAGTLAVRSGDVIGQHLVIDSERGCQHPRGIIETGSIIYIPDNRNKSIYALAGQQLQPITLNNETVFRSMFSSKIDEKYLIGVYDPVRREYWIANADPNAAAVQCHVWNETINEGRGGWVSNYSMGKTLRGHGIADQSLYLVGANGTATSVYSMYTGDCGQLFDQAIDSSLEFVVNPNPSNSKVFDTIAYFASERLSNVLFGVPHDSESGGYQTSLESLDVSQREGRYPLAIRRDALGGRMRGMWMLTTMTWKSVQSALNAVDTNYRLSTRI